MISCSCPDCVSACHNDPGRLIPSDIRKISAFLGISDAELIRKYLVKKKYVHKNVTVLIPAPAKLKGKNLLAEPGTITPEYYEKESGRCIFLDDKDHCIIHSVKPYECSAYMGCKHTFLGKPYKAKFVEEFFFNKWKAVTI